MIYIVVNEKTGVESQVTESHFKYLQGKDHYSCKVLGDDPIDVQVEPTSTDYTVKEVQGMAKDMSQQELEEFCKHDDRKTVQKLLE